MASKLSENGLNLITAGLLDIYAPKTILGEYERGSHLILFDGFPISIQASTLTDATLIDDSGRYPIYQQPSQIEVGDTFLWRCQATYDCAIRFLDGYYMWRSTVTDNLTGTQHIGESGVLSLENGAIPYEEIRLSSNGAPAVLHTYIWGIRIK